MTANTPILVAEAAANPRYRWERNHGAPRKIGSKLWLYDCINCDKCVPVCPNDANFVYETQPATIEYDNFDLLPGQIRRLPGGSAARRQGKHQLANYADACNECGNCDVFCPEDGGPFKRQAALLRQPGHLAQARRRQRLLHGLDRGQTSTAS